MSKDALSRLMSRVSKTETCWLWTGPVNSSGYGGMGFQGRTQGAHRVAYQLLVGPIQQGLHVLHRCDNPRCVNPEHLWVGTRSENMQDASRKGRTNPFRGAGEANPRARLTRAQVVQAREWRAQEVSYAEIGRRLGVNSGTVHHAVNGRNWRGLDG